MYKLISLLLPLLVTGCLGLGSKHTKHISEFTPKLVVNSQEPIMVVGTLKPFPFNKDITKQAAYNITKGKIVTAPTVFKGVIYILDDQGKVYAFSQQERKILWTQQVTNRSHAYNHLGGGIAVSNDKLLITNGSRHLIVLDINTGYEIMRKEFPDIIRIKPLILTADSVLIQTVSNQVFAYDFANSKFLWQHEGMFETLATSSYIRPLLYDSSVLVNYSSGQICSLSAKGGEENWLLNLAESLDVTIPSFVAVTISCPFVVDGGNAYIASSIGKIMKIALNTGTVLWETKASDVQSMTLNGNSLFITNNAKQVAAISTDNGKVKWLATLEPDMGNHKTTNHKTTRHKTKAVRLFKPLITKDDKGFVLSIATSSGVIYNFHFGGNTLSSTPTITEGLKSISFMSASDQGIYLFNDKQLIFSE